MATQRKRTPPKVDKATATAMSVEAKEKAMNDALDAPIPEGDGLDHARWPAEARKLALLIIDPTWIGATQDELAKECGYSLRSVNRYVTDPDFKAYLNDLAGKAYDDLYPLFVAAMTKGLRSGNSKFVEMFMRSRGMLKEVRQVESKIEVHTTTSTESLDAEIEKLERTVYGNIN